jgi:hypothetical protein
MVRACVWLAIAFEVLTLAAPAGAEPSSPPTRPWDPVPAEPAPPPERAWDDPAPVPPKPERRWYGWQTLATDGAAIALLVGTASAAAAADLSEGPLLTTGYTLGLVTYALGGPIVHFSHGNTWRGLASFGIRVPVPLLVIAASYEIECSGSGGACGEYTVLFGASAIIAAMVVDAAVFAFDDVPVGGAENQTLRLLPVVGLDRRGGSLGLALTL